MRRNVGEDYGEKFNYDPQWKGPLELERKTTDPTVLMFFILYVVVWIFIGAYTINTGEITLDALNPQYERNLELRRSIDEPNDGKIHFGLAFSRRAMIVACAFGVIAILMNYFSLILISYHPKALYYSTSIFTLSIFILINAAMAAAIPYALQHEKHALFGILLVGSGSLFVINLLWIYLLIRFRKKVRIACGMVQESVKAVMFFPSALFIPVLELIVQLIPLVFFLLTYLFLSGHPMLKQGAEKPIQYYLIYYNNIFGFFWTTQFIYAFSKMVLSGTFATWYWSHNKDQIPSAVVCRFMAITTRFHLGTLAFGSMIIAIFKFIRSLLESKKEETRRQGGDLGVLILIIIASCLLSCVESFVNFINSNAYIMCTIHGTDFIQSGKDAYHMIMRNVMNIVILRNVTGTITCPLLMLMFAVTLGGTYAFCSHMTQAEIFAAMLVVTILLIVVSSLVFQVLGEAVDTIFLCAMEDFERNDGSNAHPNFMSPHLKQLLLENI